MNLTQPHRARLGVLATVIAALCLALPAAASANTISERTPFDTVLSNACFGGELVFVEGTVHTIMDEDGSHIRTNIAAKGFSLDGTPYNYKTHLFFHQTVDTDPSGATVFHNSYLVMLNRQGSDAPDDDLVQEIRVHMTVNANGETTSSHVDFGGTECQ